KFDIELPEAEDFLKDQDPDFKDFTAYLRLPKESASRRQTAFEVAGFVVLMLVGVWVAQGPAIMGAIDALRTSDWVEVEGAIRTSRVAFIKSQRKIGVGYTTVNRYGIQLTYEYTLNGMTYTSDQLRVGRSFELFDTESQAYAAYEAHYTPGTRMPVFVNPAQPSEAYLLRGTAPGQGARSRWLGYGLMLLASLTAIKTIRQFRRRQYFVKRYGGSAAF
ncbi:MAG: DUF3592 domain-containing protein, partial [Pseudomonadota bacterium]